MNYASMEMGAPALANRSVDDESAMRLSWKHVTSRQFHKKAVKHEATFNMNVSKDAPKRKLNEHVRKYLNAA